MCTCNLPGILQEPFSAPLSRSAALAPFCPDEERGGRKGEGRREERERNGEQEGKREVRRQMDEGKVCISSSSESDQGVT